VFAACVLNAPAESCIGSTLAHTDFFLGNTNANATGCAEHTDHPRAFFPLGGNAGSATTGGTDALAAVSTGAGTSPIRLIAPFPDLALQLTDS
jgi:hypothetical protein